MKPSTEGRRCRYVDLLVEEGLGGAVSSGRPFYFISHGWSRPFSELVNMCKRQFDKERQRAWRRGLPPLHPSEVGRMGVGHDTSILRFANQRNNST